MGVSTTAIFATIDLIAWNFDRLAIQNDYYNIIALEFHVPGLQN